MHSEHSEQQRHLPTRPATILVVDDEPTILELVGEALTEDGFRVTLAADLVGALDALDRERFDLVLADALAGSAADFTLDEWPALDTLRDRAAPARVVVFSAHPARHFAAASERGFAGFVAKPFDLDTLVASLNSYLAASSFPVAPPPEPILAPS
jgi:two-component system response regulator GlrR